MPFEHTDRAAQLRARERGGESRHARADYGDVDALHDVILATESLWLFLRLLSSARIWAHGEASAHYRNHRSGRLIPCRIAHRKRVRRLRNGPSIECAVSVAH